MNAIKWNQCAWYTRRDNSKVCWRWKGTRKDGRSFKILFVRNAYVCVSFNGSKIGEGKTLADAQKMAESAPGIVFKKKEENRAVI